MSPFGRGLRLGVAFTVALCVLPLAAQAALPPLENLRPGERADVHQDVPVTVVFVGLEAGSGPARIDVSEAFDPGLPKTRVLDRTTFEGAANGSGGAAIESAAIGLTYDYDYRSVFAGEDFEDDFFGYLASIAEGPIPGGTIFQQIYSSHPLAAEQIDAAYKIDAVKAERWLAANAGRLGVDSTRPTVFYVNWYGRPDFRFHTYGFSGVRPGFPVALGDTHLGQMSAWGGTPPDPADAQPGALSRVWMYDVSAGPDFWMFNFLLDVADVDGDGQADRRLPPIWEYGTTHWYAPFQDLTGDLLGLLRFVAVDALFGASPIYDPALSEPLLPDRAELDLNLFAGRPDRHPAATLRVGALPGIFGRLDPTRTFPVDPSVAPLAGKLGDVFDCHQTSFTPFPSSCFGSRYQAPDDDPFYNQASGDLDLWFTDQRLRYLDATRYEIPLAVFDVPESRLVPGALAGLASNSRVNLQGWTYAWLADRFRFENGFTDTGQVVHEAGHHLGLSHVHDIRDDGLGLNFSATGDFAFLRGGLQTYTVMSYLPNTDEFGQFDRDNMARWQLATRIDNANRILGDVAASPRSSRAASEALAADAAAGRALAALEQWDLAGAGVHAKTAYGAALAAASAADVKVEPYAGPADTLAGRGVIDAAVDRGDLGAAMLQRVGDPLARYGR